MYLGDGMAEIELYGHKDSGHAVKVAVALSLMGVDHRRHVVDIWAPRETRPAEFLVRSPFAEVPLLVMGDESFTQSGAILMMLAERNATLGGETQAGLQRARELILWEANRIGMCLPQLIESRRDGGSDFPGGAVTWLRARYETDRDRFDLLLGGAPFFHGHTPGAGDCAIYGYVSKVALAGVAPSRAMSDWIERMNALPEMRRPSEFFQDDALEKRASVDKEPVG